MSLKSELRDLLESADKKIHALADLAVSERNRLLEAVQHARSAVESSQDPATDADPAKKPAAKE